MSKEITIPLLVTIDLLGVGIPLTAGSRNMRDDLSSSFIPLILQNKEDT